MGGGSGLERDMEGCDVFNSHRLSQSLPGLNGSIPQTTEMVIWELDIFVKQTQVLCFIRI